MDKFFLIAILVFWGIAATFQPLQAGMLPCGTSENPEECTLCHFFLLIQRYITGLTFALAGFSLLVFVVIGLMFLLGSVKPEGLAKAKKALTAAITGFIIVLVAWLLIAGLSVGMQWKPEVGGTWWKIHCEAD